TGRTAIAVRAKVAAAIATARSERLAAALTRWRDLLNFEDGENVLPELNDRLGRAANLVFATCATATPEAVTPDGARSRFDWVVVEEAAKAWPTERGIPPAPGTLQFRREPGRLPRRVRHLPPPLPRPGGRLPHRGREGRAPTAAAGH